ncbi:MAG: hypothetical protein QM504_18155 [Pseudomonadota bacterium]
MKPLNLLKLFWLLSALSITNITSSEELPTRLQVALMQKIITLENNLASKTEISIYVLDAPKISQLLGSGVGLKLGNATLKKVDSGKNIPNKKYDVIYIGSLSKEKTAIKYAVKNKIMSLYPIIDGMNNLGSLGLGIKSGRPTFLLNIGESKAEGLNWDPAILRVSTIK